MDAKEEGYKPEAGYQEDSREALVNLTLTDSTEPWLIQWPQNELPDFQGTELPLSLHGDGCLGSFEGLSGKAYDVVSCTLLKNPMLQFSIHCIRDKICWKYIKARVTCPLPRIERQEAEKKSKRIRQMSAGSLMTPAKSSIMLRNPSSSSRVTNSS